MVDSILDGVPGIGPVRKRALLKHFGSLKKIREASVEELGDVLPGTVAETLHRHLQGERNAVGGVRD
jgi:excinuclease ABC subunit C